MRQAGPLNATLSLVDAQRTTGEEDEEEEEDKDLLTGLIYAPFKALPLANATANADAFAQLMQPLAPLPTEATLHDELLRAHHIATASDAYISALAEAREAFVADKASMDKLQVRARLAYA